MASFYDYKFWPGSGFTCTILFYLILVQIVDKSLTLSPSSESSVFIRCNGDQTHDCGYNKCLPLSKLCDGTTQCQDGSDELNCEDGCKPPQNFECHNKHCIPYEWRCDGSNDCMDWTDEEDCDQSSEATTSSYFISCNETQTFDCGNNQCLPFSLLCDGVQQCPDGSDEEKCKAECKSPNWFECHNKHCILAEWKCDGSNDCMDWSDEDDCDHTTEQNGESYFIRCNGNSTHDCGNGQCLPLSNLCDGVQQCEDGSDENNCKADCQSPHWFECHNKHCISTEWRCDGTNDCMDWSDEDDCEDFVKVPELKKACSYDEFKCNDGRCISLTWTCDRQHDCEHGEDESENLCKGKACLLNSEFTCNNGDCISNSWKCDGTKDCSDGSDEASSLCNEDPKFNGSCNVEHGEFLCKDGSLCVAADKVCDSKQDCNDQSDEEHCNANLCDSFGCSQGCVQRDFGPSCFCSPGFTLASDKKNCLDVDECSQFGICSQKCINTPGSYSCFCLPGYTMINGSCFASSGETILLFSTKTEVRGVSLSQNRYFSVARNLPHVIGVAFDPKERRVYWTDVMAGRETIFSSRLDGTATKILVTSGLDMPEDLVVDEVNRNIYFTDSIARHIGVCGLEQPHSCAVIRKELDQPRAIALHHGRQLVLFTDWGVKKKCVGVMNMDGTDLKNLVADNLGWPNGLAVDEILDRVYWSDAKMDKVESVRLDGSDRRIVLDSIVKHPFSLAVFEDRMYWSDWDNRDVMSCNKFTGKDLQVHVKEIGVQPFGITISHPILSKNHTSPCWPSNSCSHICLPSSKIYACACPAHLTLGSDKMTCSVPLKTTSLILSTRNVVYQIHPQTIGLDEFIPIASVDNIAVTELVGNSLDDYVLVLARTFGGGNHIAVLDRNQKKLVDTITGSTPGSISYDPRSKTVFWTDYRKMSILAQSLTKLVPVYIASGLVSPMSLLVVPENNVLVLGEAGHISLLQLGPQELSSRRTVSSTVVRPNCLAYSPLVNALFIGDSRARSIYRWDWDSFNVVALVKDIGKVTSIATKDNFLYWTEEDKTELFWISLTSGSKETSWMSLEKIASISDDIYVTMSGSYSRPDLNTGCSNSPCSHLCIPGDGPKNFACSCPFGMELSMDGLNCKASCPENSFKCGNGQCIRASWKCDEMADCSDKSDEENCETTTIPKCDNGTHVSCANGDCIMKEWWCDGEVDCTDGSDESQSCPSVSCDEGKFSCKDGKRCLLKRWKCDGDEDCRDGSDEEDCSVLECLDTEFACSDGLKCIQKNWRCDAISDCNDGSDEVDCKNNEVKCGQKEFSCKNGDCVDLALMCDGQDDCGDGSEEDEKICGKDEDPYLGVDCEQGFKCESQCLHGFVRCNGTADCPDGSDEEDCPLCTRDSFRCINGEKCVPRSWMCDEIEDCGDGSDETECDYKRNNPSSSHTCDSSQFKCLSGECLPLKRACDRNPDCVDSSDEDFESCSSACSSSQCLAEQTCQPTPQGPICRCNPGFALSPAGRCEDANECNSFSSCAQMCTNTKGSYKCHCGDGFIQEGRLCRPSGELPRFLYAIGIAIKTAEETRFGSHIIHRELSTHAKPVTSFVYNENTMNFFWSSSSLGLIGNKKLDEVEAKNKVWMDHLERPAELALDWREGNLYYSSQRKPIVTVCNIEKKVCKLLLDIPKKSITKIVVDPISGIMFVAGYSRTQSTYPTGAIFPFTMSGSPIPGSGVIEDKIAVVSGLTIDPIKKLVFWSDATSRDLRMCNYMGGDCRVVATSSQPRPTGLTMLSSKLYWTTGSLPWVHSHEIVYNSTVERTFSIPSSAHSLAFSHPSLQPINFYPSICKSFGCSHLCLLSNSTSAVCACPTGFELYDGSSCQVASQAVKSETDQSAEDHRLSSLELNDKKTNIIILVMVLLFFLLATLAIILIKCRRTKQGTEMGMRFTNLGFGLPQSSTCGVEDDCKLVNVERNGDSAGCENPWFDAVEAHIQNANDGWPDCPDILTPKRGDHSTPLMRQKDTDSAYQESCISAGSSYEDDDDNPNHLLSNLNYNDKHRLLD